MNQKHAEPEVFEIREATLDDLDAICALGHEVNRLHHEAWPNVFAEPADLARDAQHWRQSIETPNAVTLVGVTAGQVVGFVTVFLVAESSPLLQPDTFARIGTVCVAETVRNRGLGRLLMRSAEQWAVRRGASDLRLNVWAFNNAAKQFYGRLGFGVRSHSLAKALRSKA